jgi:acyl carrier protein
MNFEDLKSVILRVFPEESGLQVEMKRKEISSWDSFGHLNLILELEDSLRISFTKEEIENINSLDVLLDIINSKYNTSES